MVYDTPSDVLTIEDVAAFLRIPVSSVYRLAQQGKIPAQKIGRHWRFYRPALLKWMAGETQDPAQTIKTATLG